VRPCASAGLDRTLALPRHVLGRGHTHGLWSWVMPHSRSEAKLESIELTAVLVAVTDEEPRVLTIQNGRALPTGPFASGHRSLQMGVRAWVEHQTHHPLGYLEQLYTFADRDRVHGGGEQRMTIDVRTPRPQCGLTRHVREAGALAEGSGRRDRLVSGC
jgi:hypothetical protein